MQMTPDAAAPLFGYRVIYCDGDSDYTASPSVDIALGGHDGVPYPLTAGRRLCIDMDRTVHNVAGADLTVYRPTGSGTATVKGSNSYLGPWTTIGTANAAHSAFDISSSGLDSVRYIELTSSGTFNVDAIEGANDYVGLAEARLPVSSYQFPILRASSRSSGSVRFALSTSPPPDTRLVIRDATGRLVHSSLVIRASSFRLDLRSMPAGVYFATLNTGSVVPVRFVVTR